MSIKIIGANARDMQFIEARNDSGEYITIQIGFKNNCIKIIKFDYHIGATSSTNDVADLLIELGKSMKTDKNQ